MFKYVTTVNIVYTPLVVKFNGERGGGGALQAVHISSRHWVGDNQRGGRGTNSGGVLYIYILQKLNCTLGNTLI